MIAVNNLVVPPMTSVFDIRQTEDKSNVINSDELHCQMNLLAFFSLRSSQHTIGQGGLNDLTRAKGQG